MEFFVICAMSLLGFYTGFMLGIQFATKRREKAQKAEAEASRKKISENIEYGPVEEKEEGEQK